MSQPDSPDEPIPFPISLFRIGGRIRPIQYFIAIGIAFAALIAAFGFSASVMSPTGGGGGAFLAIPMFFLFVWVIAAAIVQRLRDAGRPVAWALAFILGPLLLLFPGLEMIEYAGIPMALTFVAILLAPGFIKPKHVNEPAAPK